MPYYCTVPRCTSMAGKAKNVSFHQFPRDEELAKLWNRILKRGKPYTKYSKVCSLHFRPEDYTITSVGKNKGQWRTLRKDAIPSQNLPSESPVPYTRSSPGAWLPSQPTMTDPLVQQQMAQAIYMQTMLAMQAAGASDATTGDQPTQMPESPNQNPSSSSLSEIDLLLRRDEHPKEVTYKCHECTKCFKDPDVFILHKRTHKATTQIEKENYSTNIQDREETLRANPILANLLKTSMRLEPESNMSNILTVENQIMAALASNMEAYIRTLSSLLSSQVNRADDQNVDYDETKDSTERDEEYDTDVNTNNHIDEDSNDQNAEVKVFVSRIETPVDESRVSYNDADLTEVQDVSESDDNDKRSIDDNECLNIQDDNDKMETREEKPEETVNENCDSKENAILDENRLNSNMEVDNTAICHDEACAKDDKDFIDANHESDAIDENRRDENEGKLDQTNAVCDTETNRMQLEV